MTPNFHLPLPEMLCISAFLWSFMEAQLMAVFDEVCLHDVAVKLTKSSSCHHVYLDG